ncbi:hypothetical protein HX855_12075 [Pseudomonas sp. IPO3778]|nr:hypothetical protein [Pseudomonas sp. IPO3779]NWD17518.1 hypothetical protein [Pseudomonas sp. IPO3778]
MFWIVNPQEHEGVVASWLEGTILEERDTYHLIAPATRARKDLQDKLQGRFNEEFLQTLTPKDARVESLKKAKETMSNLAGLHNPDLSAGGKDIIADFGDRQVNSSIGPQWKNKIENLKSVAENISKPMRESTFLNVRLHKY